MFFQCRFTGLKFVFPEFGERRQVTAREFELDERLPKWVRANSKPTIEYSLLLLVARNWWPVACFRRRAGKKHDGTDW